MKAFFFVFLMAVTAQAGDIRPLFQALHDSGEKYEIVGTVCEQVAKLMFEKTYPAPAHKVITGIAYGQRGGRTIGELDVVVFDTRTQKAMIVAEVKCWNKLDGARKKANEQRARFIATLQRLPQFDLACTDHSCAFRKENFTNVQKFMSISQAGGEKFGFEAVLPYSLQELMSLREMLLKCQNSGACQRPRVGPHLNYR